MNDVDQLIRAELDRAFPAPAAAPDWDEVVRRVRRPRRRRRLGTAALALAAAGAALAALGAPWRAGPSFTARALAAIGTQRYVVAAVEPARAYGSVVDLATGAERPAKERTVYVVDSGSSETIPKLSSWKTIDGVTVSASDQGNLAGEPGLASFLGGYRKALADGSARVAGETTFRGRHARILRFTFDYAVVRSHGGLVSQVHRPGGATEDVAVDAATYRPLWVERTETWITAAGPRRLHEGRDVILSIASVSRPPAQPRAAESRIVLTRPALKTVTRATAPLTLGPRAVWPGSSVAGLRFRSARLEQLWPVRPGTMGSAGLGLRLVYSARGRTLEVRESARPVPYGVADVALLPPAGKLRLSCYGCNLGRWPGGRAVWLGQLRSGRFVVAIEAPARAVVVAAARALGPMP